MLQPIVDFSHGIYLLNCRLLTQVDDDVRYRKTPWLPLSHHGLAYRLIHFRESQDMKDCHGPLDTVDQYLQVSVQDLDSLIIIHIILGWMIQGYLLQHRD